MLEESHSHADCPIYADKDSKKLNRGTVTPELIVNMEKAHMVTIPSYING